jgi:DNA-binding MarR family transcriptional regulator
MRPAPDETARHLLETVPLVMRTIRSEMRTHRAPDLSVPQFRALGYIDRNPGASLSGVAEHMGLTLPSVSKLVDGLVARALATRQEDRADRRRVVLRLTPAGRNTLAAARKAAQQRLAARLAAFSNNDRAAISQAMTLLRSAFASGPRAGEGKGAR